MLRAAPFWGCLGRPLARPRSTKPTYQMLLQFCRSGMSTHSGRRSGRCSHCAHLNDRNPLSAKYSAQYAAAPLRRLRSLMGQGGSCFRMSTLSGACVLCVLVRHLMGSAGCGVAWLKSQSARKSRSNTIGAICRSLPRASLLLELDSASCLVDLSGLTPMRTRSRLAASRA